MSVPLKGCAITLWASVGLAGLTKGPFVLAILIATLVALAAFDVGRAWRSPLAWRQAIAWWRQLRPWAGLVVVSAIVLPWLVAATMRDRTFVANLLLEPLRHVATNQSGGHPPYPGYHLLSIWITFFPWSFFLPAAAVHAWRHRRVRIVRFALATIIGNLVFVELMVTKLPHYLLPAYAALALLTASALLACAKRIARSRVRKWNGAALVWTTATIGFALVPWLVTRQWPDVSLAPAFACAIVGILYAIVTGMLLARRNYIPAAWAMGLGLFVSISVVLTAYLPNASFLRVPESVATTLRERGATEKDQVVAIGVRFNDLAEYAEPGLPAPSLAFYQGGTIRERPDDFLEQTPVARWPRWIVITSELYDQLPAERRAHLREIARFTGANYNIPFGDADVRVVETSSRSTTVSQ